MSRPCKLAATVTSALLALSPSISRAAETTQITRLIESHECRACNLNGADLVNAELQNAQLSGARLQQSNLSGSILDGADLRGADLSYASLAGASLRGADLRKATLIGTDLRQADLTGARLSAGTLSQSHWQQAKGIPLGVISYAEIHNAGVAAAKEGRSQEAEQFFSAAIRLQPEAAISWVARGISRNELGLVDLAARDFHYAGELYRKAGATNEAKQLETASKKLLDSKDDGNQQTGSGLASGAAAMLSILGPLAIAAFLPFGI